MKKYLNNKVLHAVLWILIYVVTVNIGEYLSEVLMFPYITSIAVLFLSIFLCVYIGKNRLQLTYDLTDKPLMNSSLLIYIPLFIIGVIQLIKGFDESLDKGEILSITFLMIGVGLIEEVIFRGFLLNGIREKCSIKKAIIISGVTFGVGHIVNLARGYGYNELIAQILVAIVIGIILAMLVVSTKKLLPGILFHIIFNITGSITIQNQVLDNYILITILFIAIPYGIYLFNRIKAKMGQFNTNNLMNTDNI